MEKLGPYFLHHIYIGLGPDNMNVINKLFAVVD